MTAPERAARLALAAESNELIGLEGEAAGGEAGGDGVEHLDGSDRFLPGERWLYRCASVRSKREVDLTDRICRPARRLTLCRRHRLPRYASPDHNPLGWGSPGSGGPFRRRSDRRGGGR